MGTTRADALYDRVLSDYGDDSVAQLGGVHLACEGASNLLTKVLEWGRLMAYLQQSTRYVPYTDRPGGQWQSHLPAELDLGGGQAGGGRDGTAIAEHFFDRRWYRLRAGAQRILGLGMRIGAPCRQLVACRMRGPRR